MKIKCLLIDDEPLAIKVIKNHLESFDYFEITHTCSNAIEAFNVIAHNAIDLIFLDINMPKLNGIEFIKNLDNPPFIIITTAYREYALESFELDVVDYLVKPISLKRFMKSLQKVSRLYQMQNDTSKNNLDNALTNDDNNYFFINVSKKMIKVYYDDILYIESLKDYVSIKTIYENFTTHYNLLNITKMLPDSQFMRIHRSYTIAVNKVNAVDGNCIQIKDKMLPIGRNYLKDVKNKILKGVVH